MTFPRNSTDKRWKSTYRELIHRIFIFIFEVYFHEQISIEPIETWRRNDLLLAHEKRFIRGYLLPWLLRLMLVVLLPVLEMISWTERTYKRFNRKYILVTPKTMIITVTNHYHKPHQHRHHLYPWFLMVYNQRFLGLWIHSFPVEEKKRRKSWKRKRNQIL